MDNNYFKMNSAIQTLNHIRDCLEFANCKVSEGVEGEVVNGYTVEMVNKLKKHASNHLLSAIATIGLLTEAYDMREINCKNMEG